MTLRLVHEYKKDWEIDVNLCKKDYRSINPFSPIPGVDLMFDFRALHEIIVPYQARLSLSVFQLKLEKLYGFNINPALELCGKITVQYNSYHTFKEYKTSSLVNVEKMSCIDFEKQVSSIYDGNEKSIHDKRMAIGPLTLKCELSFFAEISIGVACRRESSLSNRFIEEFKSLFKSNVLSDVVLNIGAKSIPAHKVILATHSPVFMTMLTQEFLESKTNTVEITDCTYEIFESFLKYLYFREIEDKSYPTITKLNVLADKYDVSGLKVACAEILISLMSVDNIFEILKNAYDYNNDELKIPAIQFATVHFHELRAKDEWKALVRSHPLICYEVAENIIPKG